MMQPIGQSSKKKIQQSHQKKYLIEQKGKLREKSTIKKAISAKTNNIMNVIKHLMLHKIYIML